MFIKSVLWLNGRKRRKHSIYRCCGENHDLSIGKSSLNKTEQRLWEELINYHTFEDGSIVETKSAIGYLKHENGRLENTLMRPLDNNKIMD
jgi:hypothetical protein